MEKLHELKIKNLMVTTIGAFNIFPSKNIATSVVEPYNAIFYVNKMLELQNPIKDFLDFHVVFDNEALYKVCKNSSQLDIKTPVYDDLNLLIAQCFATLTLGQRFKSESPKDLNDIKNNLCPYDRLKFLMTAYAPLYNN